MNDIIKQLYQSQQGKTYNQLNELFETNYAKILKLIPNIKKIKNDCIAQQHQTKPLYLFLEERTKYTGVYTLTHRFDNINKPDIRFKIYFDAKLVETLSICNDYKINQKHQFLNNCSDLEQKWELNYFLEKWFDYCLNQQYVF
ncbi:hypothetical protein MNB_SUP05-5-566 [hydrothermal vent metagenome]|uniref:DUF1249 domain-containing protein n=1 Tax=hydrothermal vent metagenome TaxID=652676 RepID=A0A1W1CJ56_9ZZZZ